MTLPTETNPVETRWSRLIDEHPDIPRNTLHDIYMAGVEAKADDMTIELFSPCLTEEKEEPSSTIRRRFFRGL